MKRNKKAESQAIKRLRVRLEKHISEQDEKISPEALQEQSKMIRAVLARNAPSRVDLKDKTLRLFDKNRHPAKEAKATERIRELIKMGYFPLRTSFEEETSVEDAPLEP
ncbi:MAG: hypothetical protein KDK62_08530 [Chlamydiia bacterium]|nr:hypothetical protein [Chlamydiia bacterium]